MPERNTAARAVTENTKPSTKYTYDYNYLPPLAMVGALSPAEGFAARPDWIYLVSISALRILINSIMIGVKNKGDNIEFVPEVLQALNAVAQLLGADTKRDLSNAIAMELEKQGSPTTLPELKVFLEGVIESFAKTLTLETLLDIGQSLGKFANCLRSSFQPGRLQPIVPIHLIAGGQPEFSRGCRVCRHASGWTESAGHRAGKSAGHASADH